MLSYEQKTFKTYCECKKYVIYYNKTMKKYNNICIFRL